MSRNVRSLLTVFTVLAVICPLCVMEFSDDSDADSKSMAGYGSSPSLTVWYSEGFDSKMGIQVGVLKFSIPGIGDLRENVTVGYDDITGVSMPKNMVAGHGVSLNTTLNKGVHTVSITDGVKTFSTDFTVGVELRGMVLNMDSYKGDIGDTVQLEIDLTPWNALDSDIVWLSSDKSVAEVDGSGKVTLTDSGTAFITVRSMSTGIEQICSIGVNTEPLPNPEPGTDDEGGGKDSTLLIAGGAAGVVILLLAVTVLMRRR